MGVCALEKKVRRGPPTHPARTRPRVLTATQRAQAKSKPMTQILERLLAYGEFEVVYFGDKCINEAPVESWPLCDCLISFYSENFPLAKAEAYAQLRKPFVLNDLSKQHWLLECVPPKWISRLCRALRVLTRYPIRLSQPAQGVRSASGGRHRGAAARGGEPRRQRRA